MRANSVAKNCSSKVFGVPKNVPHRFLGGKKCATLFLKCKKMHRKVFRNPMGAVGTDAKIPWVR